jgi:hypothetical protein
VQIAAIDSVRVLEVSVAGVLLHASTPLAVGAKAQLQLSVAGSPLTAEIHVKRVSPVGAGEAGYHIGAEFLAITPEQRQLVERFISQ